MNPLTKVSTLMTSELITVPAFTPIGEAKKLLDKHSIHHLPVVSPEGKLEGILSHADFLKVVEKYDASQTVSSIMSSHLAKLEPDDTVRTAANLFALNRFHALPVVEGEKLVGILTTLDLIRLMDAEKVDLSDY
ncbi:CBS domain-containing protein [Neolewinella agarilytica]|uniref:Acetoin utilization protein AcuB n=1 Tax=Neolewinella agarilytica TaxID=478744 RepID=A0A1H9ENI8_9BACT|nr:CBS domain-containing protein [Neolewinella agarilytica]SEQ27209.1 acetoin utilization protein AcuB [Neolewinella agarilytica]